MNVAAALLAHPQTLLLWLMILVSGCGNVLLPTGSSCSTPGGFASCTQLVELHMCYWDPLRRE